MKLLNLHRTKLGSPVAVPEKFFAIAWLEFFDRGHFVVSLSGQGTICFLTNGVVDLRDVLLSQSQSLRWIAIGASLYPPLAALRLTPLEEKVSAKPTDEV